MILRQSPHETESNCSENMTGWHVCIRRHVITPLRNVEFMCMNEIFTHSSASETDYHSPIRTILTKLHVLIVLVNIVQKLNRSSEKT